MALVDNLKAYYHFQNDFLDAKNGYDGVGNNSPSFVSGIYNNDVELIPTNSQNVTVSSFDIDESVDMAWSFWVYPYFTAGSAYYNVMRWKLGSNNNLGIKFDTNGNLQTSASNTNPVCQTSVSGIQNTWQHIVLCVDSSGPQHILYLNGTQVDSDNFVYLANGTATFYIGSTADPQYYFDGIIGEVAVWQGKFLTSTEVTDLYNGGTGKFYDAGSDSFVAPGSGATKYGTIQVQTPSGLIDVNIYDLADIDNNYIQVQTSNGLGAINLVDPGNADTPIQIETENQGLMGIKKSV